MIGGDVSGSVTEDGPTLFSGQLSVADPDGADEFVPYLGEGNAGYGNFDVNSDGTWSYQIGAWRARARGGRFDRRFAHHHGRRRHPAAAPDHRERRQ